VIILDYKSFLKKLKSYKGTRITEKGIRELSGINDYEEYYHLVMLLIQNNVIAPYKNSGSNGMSPPLYKRYRLIKEEQSYDEYIDEIRSLHSALNIEGYLNQPAKYIEHKKWLDPLDAFLKTNMESLKTAVSINERSFQIFHQEKALSTDKELAGVLHFNKGVQSLLNYYLTPEPFFTHNIVSYSEIGQAEINILICENKDTWYTLRRIMMPGRNVLFGVSFHILLFGEGKKITRKSSTLTDYDRITLGGFESKYYYFGDIDYEGIEIFNSLVEQNKALHIQLMTPLYRRMLQKAEGIPLPQTKDQQSGKRLDSFLVHFEQEERKRIEAILSSRQYIPQEILNLQDFMKYLEEDEGYV